MTVDRDGTISVVDGCTTNSMSRYDPAGQPRSFSSTGTNSASTGKCRACGPDVGMRRMCVAPSGDLSILRSNNGNNGGDDGDGVERVVDVFRFCLKVPDTNGDLIGRIGGYGNADSAGPGSPLPEPGIAFAWPAFLAVSEDRLSVSDSVNRRVTVIRRTFDAERTCQVRSAARLLPEREREMSDRCKRRPRSAWPQCP